MSHKWLNNHFYSLFIHINIYSFKTIKEKKTTKMEDPSFKFLRPEEYNKFDEKTLKVKWFKLKAINCNFYLFEVN
jgi:hypothetical protein